LEASISYFENVWPLDIVGQYIILSDKKVWSLLLFLRISRSSDQGGRDSSRQNPPNTPEKGKKFKNRKLGGIVNTELFG
jgi:hypothetical protein